MKCELCEHEGYLIEYPDGEKLFLCSAHDPRPQEPHQTIFPEPEQMTREDMKEWYRLHLSYHLKMSPDEFRQAAMDERLQRNTKSFFLLGVGMGLGEIPEDVRRPNDPNYGHMDEITSDIVKSNG